jgi:signal transduction histidine kinase
LQVLINLIDNAVKYSAPDTPIILSIERFDGQAIIRVRDRGVGIPLQDQSRIFERFYRVDEARTRLPQAGIQSASDGHGLGLAIVKTLVEGMGGSISVRSKLGEGTEFTIFLPT